LAKTGRKAVAQQLGRELRSWRGSTARRHLAERADVSLGVVCVIEHGKAWYVSVSEILKVIETLRVIKVISQEREFQILKLLKIISPQKKKSERCYCHSRQYQIRRAS